jgi:hypothetical protein
VIGRNPIKEPLPEGVKPRSEDFASLRNIPAKRELIYKVLGKKAACAFK